MSFTRILFLNFLISISANALPLLSESIGGGPTGDGTADLFLYPDHKDPNRAYFFPNAASFVKGQDTKIPLFGLQTWGKCESMGITPGGHMSFTMKLTPSEGQLEELRRWKGNSTDRTYSPLPVKTSTVGLYSIKEDGSISQGYRSKFYDTLFIPPHAGQVDTPVGISADLTALGAASFKSVIRGGNSQFGKFDYCFELEGLGPIFDAHVYINVSETYKYFKEVQKRGGFLFWGGKTIVNETQNLAKNGLLRIETNGGSDDDLQNFWDIAIRLIEGKMFKPAGAHAPADSGGARKGFFPLSTYELNNTYHSDNDIVDFVLTARRETSRSFCVPLPLAELKKYADEVITEVQLDCGPGAGQ